MECCIYTWSQFVETTLVFFFYRYQHRYENQKDVLRTLLDLIEEAKKADQLVNDARIGFLKAQNTELKAARTGLVAT